jgi:hypothetical protein
MAGDRQGDRGATAGARARRGGELRDGYALPPAPEAFSRGGVGARPWSTLRDRRSSIAGMRRQEPLRVRRLARWKPLWRKNRAAADRAPKPPSLKERAAHSDSEVRRPAERR